MKTQRATLLIKILMVLLFSFSIGGCLFASRPSELQRAEELSRQKKYPEAIAAYRSHMQQRLKIHDRPEWENPYFYLILIGDIELGTNKPQEAFAAFIEAESKGVDSYLVSDRIRSVARWYEDHSELDKAIEVLMAHKAKDPFLFEAMLDRINKSKTHIEDQKLTANPGPK
jgi:hypothetical protein